MENLIFGLIIITAIICYTVYKIDCNHVKKPKNDYPTGGLEEQPKDGHIDSAPLSSEWERVYKSVGEEEAYILEIGDASWAGSKERMLEILIYNKMRYEKNGKPFDFEIYPMTPKSKTRVVSFNRPSEETMESLFGKHYNKGV